MQRVVTFSPLPAYKAWMNLRRLIPAAAAMLPVLAAADLHYTLAPQPDKGTVHITLTVDKGDAVEKFRIPAWCPGFYFLLDYQAKIRNFKAVDGDGKDLQVTNPEKREWDVQDPAQSSVTVSYDVVADDGGLGFFSDNIRSDKAFTNGAATFMYPVTRKLEKDHLEVNLPEKWDIATTLDTEDGGYVAGGYDELIDYPIQMGTFERRKFNINGIPFEAVFVSPDNRYGPNVDNLAEVLHAVAKAPMNLFGAQGFKRYMFLIHLAVGNFAGGLEHRASTCIALGNDPGLDIADIAEHEFFHSWNVKQIRPVVLGPFDYTQQVRTANLWFAEGVTDYYAKMCTYRSGVKDQRWLMLELSGQIQGLQHSKNRKSITLADCSRRAWENGGFGVGDLSYYTKGLVTGLILDAAIRAKTHGDKCLDDVMRLMWNKYHLPQAGYPEDGILQAVNEVSGSDLTNLYNRMVNSTEEMPYDLLGLIGLQLDANGNLANDPNASADAVKLREAWLKI